MIRKQSCLLKGFQSFSLKGELTSHPETRGCQKAVGTGQALRDQLTPPSWREERAPKTAGARGHQPPNSECLPLIAGLSLPQSTKFIDKREHAGVGEMGVCHFHLKIRIVGNAKQMQSLGKREKHTGRPVSRWMLHVSKSHRPLPSRLAAKIWDQQCGSKGWSAKAADRRQTEEAQRLQGALHAPPHSTHSSRSTGLSPFNLYCS